MFLVLLPNSWSGGTWTRVGFTVFHSDHWCCTVGTVVAERGCRAGGGLTRTPRSECAGLLSPHRFLRKGMCCVVHPLSAWLYVSG